YTLPIFSSILRLPPISTLFPYTTLFRSSNSGMALTALAKKLFRTLARVFPQSGMVLQAVAFNMFLAFFAVLLTALNVMKSSLEGKGGQEVAMRISAILPPGSWQLISAYVLRQKVNAWYLALIGWIGTVLVGTQVMKLIIKGIELIYGDHGTHSFLGRQKGMCAVVTIN